MANTNQTNTITTEFREKGAQQTKGVLADLNVGVRNLGDSAAGAARGFSQAQKGLGGFVGAYAGAAATFFALQQGFSALKEAAKLSQSIQGTKTLASAIGVSGDEILSQIKLITRGQLTLRDAAESANLALASGFNGDQIRDLTTIATKASVALGRDLGDSFIRLVRGAAKLEPELLDELGLFTRIEPAVQAYAAQVGKSEKFLTQFERRQAFVNAVVEEGNRKYKSISLSADTAISSLERLASNVVDLGMQMGNILAHVFKPFADFLSGSFANSLSAVGLIAGLAFSKAGSVFSEFIRTSKTSVDNFFNNVQERIRRGNTKLGESFYTNLRNAAEKFNVYGVGRSDERTALIQSLQKEKVTYESITKSAALLKQQDVERVKAIEDRLKRAGVNKPVSIDSLVSAIGSSEDKVIQRAAVMKLLSDAGVQEKQKARGGGFIAPTAISELMRDVGAVSQGRGILKVTDEFEKNQTKLGKLMTGFSVAVQSSISGIATAIEKTTKWLGILVFLLSIIELIGSAVLRMFGVQHEFDTILKWFVSLGAELTGMTKQATALKDAISAVADINLAKTFKSEGFGTTDSAIFKGWFGVENPKNQAELKKELEATINKAYNSMTYYEYKGIGDYAANRMGDYSAMDLQRVFNASKYNEELQKEIENQKRLIPLNDAAVRARQAMVLTMEQLIRQGPGVIDVLRNATLTTGVSAGEILQNLDTRKLKKQASGTSMDVLGGELYFETPDSMEKRKRALDYKIKDKVFADQAKEALMGVSAANDKILVALGKRNALEKYIAESNSITEEGLAQQEVAIRNLNTEIEKQLSMLESIRDFGGILSEVDQKRLTNLRNIVNANKDINNQVLNGSIAAGFVLQRHQQLLKTFQAELNIAQEINGYTDSQGKIASRAYDIRANQLEQLENTAKYLEKYNSNSIGADGTKYLAGKDAIKIMAGMLIKNTIEVNKLNDEYQKQLIQIAAEYESIGLTIDRVIIEGTIQAIENTIKLRQLDKDIAVQRLEVESRAKTLRLQAAAEAIQFSNNRLNAEKDYIDLLIKQRDLQVSYNQVLRETNAINRDNPLLLQSNIFSEFSNLATDDQKRQLQISIDENKLADLRSSIQDQIDALDRNAVDRAAQYDLDRKLAENLLKSAQIQAAIELERINLEERKALEIINLTNAEMAQRQKLFEEQKSLAEKDREIALRKIQSDKELRDIELKVNRERVDILALEAKIFRDHAIEISKVFALAMATSVIDTDADVIKGDQDTDSKKRLEDRAKYFTDKTLASVDASTLDLNKGIESLKSKAAAVQIFSDEVFKSSKILQEEQFGNRVRNLTNEYELYKKGADAQIIYQNGIRANLDIERKTAGIRVSDAKATYDETLKKILLEEQNNKVVDETKKKELANSELSLKLAIERDKQLAKLANDPLFKFMDDFARIVKEDFKTGILALNDALVEGTLTLENFTEGLRDWALTLAKNIQTALVERTIIEPITNFTTKAISDFTMSVFKVDINKPTIESALVPVAGGYAMRVTTGEVSGNAITNSSTSDALLDKTKQTTSAVTNEWEAFTGSFANYGIALGGTFASILASGGNFQTALVGIFASIFAQVLRNVATAGSLSGVPGGFGSGLFSWIGGFGSGGSGVMSDAFANALVLNSGGSVRKMAGGGPFGRDVVPSWLEPGEYVLRSHAVNSIGLQQLNRMNNLGAEGMQQPNVSVVMHNNGTPQEVQGTPSIRFDGDKMIVDVIVRDFNNNGPIRQTLRGNNF